MRFDLCFVLIDLDEPNYRAAASEMIRSARRAYKDHDMRVVQLTDARSKHHPDADGYFGLDCAVKGNQFCQYKGFVMAEYALKAERPVIFCDVDLLWQNDGLAQLCRPDDGPKVFLMYRDNMPCMPFNTGVVVAARPMPDFWERYREACDSLPPEVCGWYGDQFAIVPPGHEFFGKGVDWLGMDAFAPALEALPNEPTNTAAVHFKGDTKRPMLPYARMLDKGTAFDFARPNVTATVDFGGMPAGQINNRIGEDMARYENARALIPEHAKRQYKEIIGGAVGNEREGWSF